ncbi:TolC family protein [Halosquirtibacter xylanolyticus]|uniref:TolC family protein n=1 Tax=Halosquirtibacter xylanolyticus TaxID=3374599 RepID=UPI0037493DA0|nr:TolC family protein [Prolixibacteraceae bacterium]
MKNSCIKIVLCFLSMHVGVVSMAQDNTSSQDPWNLDKCIQHAIQNNSAIQRQKLNSDIASNNLKTNKLSQLPSLSGGLGNTTSWGRSSTNSGLIVSNNSNRTDFNISANVNIFQGFALKNQIEASKHELEYNNSLTEVNVANLEIQVAQAYLNILVAKELFELSKEQTEITNKQIQVTREKVNGGLLDKGPLLELNAQLANNKAEEVNNQNNLTLRKLELAQLLELENPETLDIVTPPMALIHSENKLNNIDNYYQTALNLRPEINAANARIRQSSSNVKAAKGRLYPKLSASAGYSNGYYYFKNEENKSFSDQMNMNGQENVRLNLSIPIFNGSSARNSYKNAKLQAQQSKLDLVQAEKDLRKTVTNALTQARGAHQKFNASSIQVSSSKESFDFANEKFNAGAIDIYDYNQAKNSYIRAKSQKIQAKYEFIFKSKMLDFYTGTEISL